MKGDFTRGHKPDDKRKTNVADTAMVRADIHGKKYRRVLLQEGRLVLDSDIAASVDAYDTLLRDLASDVGCRTGSANLGYLVTPGPLFALFENLAFVELPAPPTQFEAWRDYGVKLKERFPSLYVGATQQDGFVVIRNRMAAPPSLQANDPAAPMFYDRLVVWAQIPLGTTLEVRVEGVPTTLVGNGVTPFHPYEIDVAALGVTSYGTVELGFSAAGPANEAWIGLIEGRQAAAAKPHFWITWGRYYLHGLEVELNASGNDGSYPEATFPAAAGFEVPDKPLVVGQFLLAYAEGWERLITRVEDPGVLEQALGGALDTTIRTHPLGQVKIADFLDDPSIILAESGEVVPAFANVEDGDGELTVTTTPTGNNPDPCAIPEEGGYTGPDNRLYRFEVHLGGNLGTATIKASKNNGSDLFALLSIDDVTTGTVTLAPGAAVREGDLVELLFEFDDLGDDSTAVVSLVPPSFRPPDRDVGELYYVRATNQTGQIQLLDFVTKQPATLDVDAPNWPGAKLRVWDALLDTATGTTFELGEGITIELTGMSFRPGAYWQYEARRQKDNANGPWQIQPHGPERIFAPLALLRYDGPDNPLVLERWYDHQFSAICDLNADDIAYDGNKVGTDADTVQEALDELYLTIVNIQGGEGCCDLTIDAGDPGDDDGVRIQDAIAQLAAGGVLCLKRGIYHVQTPIEIDKKVTIIGCPHATLLGEGGSIFVLGDGADLTLAKLIAFTAAVPDPIVAIPTQQGGPVKLTLREAALIQAAASGIAIQGAQTPPVVDANISSQLSVPSGPSVDLSIVMEDSICLGAWGIVVTSLTSGTLEGSLVVGEDGGIYAGGVDLLEVRHSRVAVVLGQNLRTTLQGLNPATLETALPPLLENLPNAVKDLSIAILVGQFLLVGMVEDSRFRGGACFVCPTGHLRSSQSIYHATTRPAVRFDIAAGVTLEHDRIISARAGLHVPRIADTVRVQSCWISAPLGVVFAADSLGQPFSPSQVHSFNGVQIMDNEIGSSASPSGKVGVGVLFGPFEFKEPLYAELDRVEVARNQFPKGQLDVAIANTVYDPAFDPEKDVRSLRTIVIEDNLIGPAEWLFGMRLFGAGLEVKRNTVTQIATQDETEAIALRDATHAVVQDNVVHAEVEGVKGVRGISLVGEFAKGAHRDAFVHGNVVYVAGDESEPLHVDGGQKSERCLRLRVIDNDLKGAASALKAVDASIIRGNRISGDLLVGDARSGVVSDNFVETREGSPAIQRLAIHDARERWQLENNRSQGHVMLVPAQQNPSLEVVYHAQVIGNWAERDLVVGHEPGGAVKPNDATTIQLNDNRAERTLIVNNYPHRIVTDNMAGTYNPPVPISIHPTVVHDLVI